MSKHIFVTGGVVSSLGKGITCASLGLLLKARGLRVKLQKFDPYLNVDPGTMNPYQHGEVYVTDDGAETDLDLGHYERFTGEPTTRDSNFTAGGIYYSVISKERRGDYLGGTIQVVPHITDEIKACINKLAGPDVDVVISEIGGTVGDIESLAFLEAIRQFGLEKGRRNAVYIHMTLVPYIRAAGEIKTKPTQHSTKMLREIGIIPDFLICRTEKPLDNQIKEKISLFCNVEKKAVIDEPDVQDSIYEVPLMFVEQGLDDLILDQLDLDAPARNMGPWPDMLHTVQHPEDAVRIAVVGKYAELQDAYKSIYEAIDHGGIANSARVEVIKMLAEDLEKGVAVSLLENADGILIPGGFGSRGMKGKTVAARYARENGVPFLGICLGLQCAAIEFARDVCDLDEANTTENDADTPHPIICLLEEQEGIEDMGATMRLGAYPCKVKNGSKARLAYNTGVISERHRHRYEFNSSYRDQFESKGMVFSGLSPDGKLIEMMELAGHPWFVATQFHPEFKSYPAAPHPLFREFIAAAVARRKGAMVCPSEQI